jgi:hypothetical protein
LLGLLSLLLEQLLSFDVFPLHFLTPQLNFISLLFSNLSGLLCKSFLSSFSLSFPFLYFLLPYQFIFSRLPRRHLIFELSSSACLSYHLSLSLGDSLSFSLLLFCFFKGL